MNAFIRNFLKEEDGVTALEYGLLAAIVAGVLVGTVKPQMQEFFTDLFTMLSAFISDAPRVPSDP